MGPNGAGKSSVLEALNTYFNDADWIVNKVARKVGETSNFINLPFVCPVFLIPRETMLAALGAGPVDVTEDCVRRISEYLWTANFARIQNGAEFSEHRHQLRESFDPEEYFLLASGVRYGAQFDRNQPHFGPFHQQTAFLRALEIEPSTEADQLPKAKANDAAIQGALGSLNAAIWSIYNYVYVPSDVSIADYTKLETNTMQLLMGRDINTEIRKAIPTKTLAGINESLEKTVEAAVAGLPDYTYDKPKGGKKKITIPSLAKLITREFFSIRELSQLDGSVPTPVSHLSSGEQRRALIDVTSNYLVGGAKRHKGTILAIDEPEISLHTSRCYDQFESLFDVARAGVQTLVTTPWYGFLPIAQNGNAHFLGENDDRRVRIDSYDLANYKEKATKRTAETKGKIPFDVSLKSANDLVQSIASSLRLQHPYSWVLCEGSSEKIYFAHMLAEEIKDGHLRILPLGGAGEVLKIYRYLEAALADRTFRSDGCVLALIDTDEQLVQYKPSSKIPSLVFRRLLLNPSEGLKLVAIESNTVSPPTAVEDVLHPETYIEVLKSYGTDTPTISYDSARVESAPASGLALDLKQSERELIREFFAVPGRKTDFAARYVKAASPATASEPLVPLLKALLSGSKSPSAQRRVR